MSSPIVQPFDFNPSSVEVKSGAYQIPVGKYAHVIPDCDDSDFTIDGVPALKNRTISNSVTTNFGGGPEINLLTVPQGKTAIVNIWAKLRDNNGSRGYIYVRYKGSANYQEDVIPLTIPQNTSASGQNQRILSSGDQIIFARGNDVEYCAISGHYINNNDANGAGFWVKAQQNLNGNRYTVALYDEIS
jgi:hypothetical protein